MGLRQDSGVAELLEDLVQLEALIIRELSRIQADIYGAPITTPYYKVPSKNDETRFY